MTPAEICSAAGLLVFFGLCGIVTAAFCAWTDECSRRQYGNAAFIAGLMAAAGFVLLFWYGA